MAITLREQYLEEFVSSHEMDCMAPQVAAAAAQLRQHTGAGSDFHGWLSLPRDFDKEELARIHAAAEKIREACACDKADVSFLTGGTQANAVVLSEKDRRRPTLAEAEELFEYRKP